MSGLVGLDLVYVLIAAIRHKKAMALLDPEDVEEEDPEDEMSAV